MKYICTILIVLYSVVVCAQQYDPQKVNKKAVKLFMHANELASDDKFKEAIALLNDAVKLDAHYLDAYISMGGMYNELKNYESAIDSYEKGRAIDSLYFKEYNLPYSISLAGTGAFEKAMSAIESFLSITDLSESSLRFGYYRKKCYQFALDYKKNNTDSGYHFEPKNLGDSVNSAFSEYFPALTIDGGHLIFTRKVNGMNEDFFETYKKDSVWSMARALEGNINTNFNEGAQNISQDGQWLIFTGCNFPEGYGGCDLYISYLTADGWSVPENMGNKINTDAWESSASLSPDKRDLYFASNRAGGYGGSDIYVSHRLPNGRWSEPENLGPTINTAGDEGSPFIHADNQTLYFTSKGWQGYGGDDLFLSRKEAKGKWGVPHNLGYPINTIGNESSLVITADGSTAYYASDRSDSRGGLDLYTFELRNDVRPIKTLWVKGKVFDKKTNNGLPSAVELTDLDTKEIISRVQTDETGNYLITLPVGKDYAFNVNRKGYLFFSDNFPLSKKLPDSTYKIDIALQPLEANATIVLRNIFFDVNKFDLKPESQVELDNVVKLMKDNPTLKIQINGHTDNVGKPADNLALSNNRAKSVVEYITLKAIDSKRLSYQGFGATQPVADNNAEEGKAQNRRTELKVVSQ